jgi:glycosyltransferase involved in cell wall biosynthesis
MRILFAHSTYQQLGGEDSVVEAETALLRSHGHDVETYARHNDDLGSMAPLVAAQQTVWSRRTTRDLADLIRRSRPDLIHAHNIFPLISPSLYWAAARAGVPVVQTLHNYRLLCLAPELLRKGQVCEDCLGHLPWRGVVHRCYRGSGAASAVLAGMLAVHRGLGTWRRKVARYIALNDFCRDKFIEGGLPAARIAVKYNFVDFPAPEVLPRHGLLFVGRLSVEKGLVPLARAAALVPDARLRVAGEGPEAAVLDGVHGVTRLGRLSRDAVRREMSSAIALVLPSICY